MNKIALKKKPKKVKLLTREFPSVPKLISPAPQLSNIYQIRTSKPAAIAPQLLAELLAFVMDELRT